jgi:DNA polymerase III subunit delta'
LKAEHVRGLFADIIGQEMAVSILTRALEQGASHAYLFAGPAGVGKTEAAIAFAAGLACPEGGCGVCATCRRVHEGLHPDVRIVAPEGNSILLRQITDDKGSGEEKPVVQDAALRPYEVDSRAKVFIISEADTLTVEAANALLKTLEEPPSHVYFILVTDRPERLLPTIASRCQLVTFSSVAAPVVAADLSGRFGLRPQEASLLARVAGGNLSYARELALSDSARRQRDVLLDLARDLPAAGLLDTEIALDEAMVSVESREGEVVPEIKAELKRALEWAGDARTRKWLEKRSEDKIKRQQRRLRTQGLQTLTRVFAGWYRDLALVSVGAEDAVLNQDRLGELRAAAVPGRLDAYTRAVGAVQRAEGRLRYNVDARCAIGDMFRSIKEALT